MHFIEPKVMHSTGLKRLALFGISIRRPCAVYDFFFFLSLSDIVLHWNALSLSSPLQIYLFEQQEWVEWCAYVKRIKKSIHCGWREKKRVHLQIWCKKADEFTQITRTNFTATVLVCIEFRNIGKLSTFHLIFGIRNSASSHHNRHHRRHCGRWKCIGVAGAFVFFSRSIFIWFSTHRCELVYITNHLHGQKYISIKIACSVVRFVLFLSCRIATSVSLTFIYCNWINRQ